MMQFAIILLGLLLTTTVVSAPQSTNTPNARRSKTKVDVKYDKASDTTTVRLAAMTVIHTDGESERQDLELSVSFSYPKQTIATPQTVKIILYSLFAGGGGFEDDRRLIVTVDGARSDLGEMKLGRSDNFSPQHDRIPWIGQDLNLSISYAEFLRISKAANVHVAVGENRFKLSDKQLQSLERLCGTYATGRTKVQAVTQS